MGESNDLNKYVRVKRKHVPVLSEELDKIRRLFSVFLNEVAESKQQKPSFVYFRLQPDDTKDDDSIIVDSFLVSRVQNYVDSIYGEDEEDKVEAEAENEGEDSSYDSDAEVDTSWTATEGHTHDNVSRTTSDTLAAEFADDCVSSPPPLHAAYVAKVEFALKLGYTEKQVQASLHKLGPNPAQNELLAELIKLGAQTTPRLGTDNDPGGLVSSDEAEQSCESHTPVASVTSDVEALRFRPIVIDGSNVAMSHGNKETFSCRGIKLCVDWFRTRGHKEITVFVPKWRKEAPRPENPITDQEILNDLEKERQLVFTPSRLVGGKRMICYDDRYILKLASEIDGIVVSNDNYRDLAQENPEYKRVIEERILMYSFVNDRFMPPDDPLGRCGPKLDNFLRVQPHPPPPCPYGKKCTYGNKCKFHHPERGPLPHKSVTERLVEHAQRQLQARGSREHSPAGNRVKGKSLSLPLQTSSSSLSVDVGEVRKTPLCRTKSNVSVVGGGSLDSQGSPLDTFTNPPARSYPMYTSWPAAAGAGVAAGVPPQVTPQTQLSDNDAGLLHRKLQRQLTLNPVCDPRLYQYHQRFVAEHQSVTRIASAPPAHPSHSALPPAASLVPQNLSSASDPQLNLSCPPPMHAATPSAWPACLRLPPPPLSAACQYSPASVSTDEARRRLHYHLASIFPEEQVQAALHMYPNESNPQKICAAILAMFPTNQIPLL